MYEIEKNIPKPTTLTPEFRKKYPLESMEIGDSFFIPCREGETATKCRMRVRTAIDHALKSKFREPIRDWKFSTLVTERKEPDGSVTQGARVWREANKS